ncbi:MAG: type II secretion system protein M [Desulfobulbaceae bacterium]|nr:type II secretion system protein M [Desulfobulbaceae bacterium]
MRLSSRDRAALFIGVGALLLFVIVRLGVYPLLDANERLRRGIKVRKNWTVEMRGMQERVRQLSNRSSGLQQQLANRSQDFSLFAFLEQQATQKGVKKNIASMKTDQQKSDDQFTHLQVEIKLQAIPLKQLVSYLEAIESPENVVAFKRILIQKNSKETDRLDVTIQVISIERTNNNGV